MHGFGIFKIHEQGIFTCESFISDHLLILEVDHYQMLLVLEVPANRQPILTERLFYLKIIAYDSEN